MPTPDERHHQLLKLLRTNSQTLETLRNQLNCCSRTVHGDLAKLEARFPNRIIRERQGRKLILHWHGPAPHPLSQTIDYLDHYELIALVAARGLFRQPGDQNFSGPLDGAIHHLIEQLGVAETANQIDPQAIEVDRFAACPENPEYLVTAIQAVLSGEGLKGEYTNLKGDIKDLHLMPLRLLLIEGEFHILAWRSPREPLKDYRLSRFTSLRNSYQLPKDAPAKDAPHLVEMLSNRRNHSFRTHGHHGSRHRETITLALSPRSIPHLRDRVWGMNQQWEDNPSDLPPGWARLSFTTAGIQAAFHWILSQGAGAIVENPPHLAEKIAEEAGAMRSYYRKPKTTK